MKRKPDHPAEHGAHGSDRQDQRAQPEYPGQREIRGGTHPGEGLASPGKRGEDRAASWLERRGQPIIARNFRTRAGEIDLVTLDGGTVVFVEVKLRTSPRFGPGREAIDVRKRGRLVNVARIFLASKGWLDRPVRFDVIEVHGPDLRLWMDAFRGDG